MGLQITGGNGFEYRFVESFPLWGGPDPDVFDFNPEFESKVCFCLAEQHYAPGWLEFDLKQQYSEYFLPRFTNPQLNLPNPDSSLAIASSSLRVTVNGEEIARFSPQSPSADTFQRHVIPLSGDTLYPYLFSDLQVCLKSRTVWSPDQALDGIGDFIFLDNIRMEGMPISIEEKLLENRWHIFPNPTTGSFSIQSNQLHSSPVQFKVLNPMGQEVWQQQMDRTLADVPISVELGQQLSRGIYFLQIIQADHQETHQLVLR
ncbi:MAG: T9SS type A sorting domain-containing protein, partial [Bacteroidota bacterium]